ncbi:PKD domain-containing protein [Spirillospora sp. CA-294931]|uniref:PKD domain-containing protein n=1 Tax=Spirillospora sp. CA-294931 TaxID=3240042 RepID=UPI003D89FE9C
MRKLVHLLGALGVAAGLSIAAPPALADPPPPPADATPMVINGQQATVQEFPFIISQHRTGGARPTEQSCTGSVVAKRIVLIAAHCKFAQGEKYLVYGRDDLANTSTGTRIEIEEYRTHPNYNANDGWRTGWDVAVIIAKTDIPTPAGMAYPPIAKSGDSLPIGTRGTAVGYGKSDKDDAQKNTKLWKTILPVVDGQNCKNINFQYDDRYMNCSGYGDGSTGLCQGDSGGPYLHNGKIYGVFSWLRTDCASYNAHGKMNGVMGDWANQQIGGTTPPGDPKAAFEASCPSGGLKCSFDASGSSDPDGSIASYKWSFGDSTSGDGRTTDHTYGAAGSYKVTLTVTDNEGKTNSTERTVNVGSTGGQNPTASFASPQCQGLSCSFNASASKDPDGSIASYAWDFGDGTKGSGVTTNHTFPSKQATYTVTLTVTDNSGNTGTTSRKVQCFSFGTGQGFCFPG